MFALVPPRLPRGCPSERVNKLVHYSIFKLTIYTVTPGKHFRQPTAPQVDVTNTDVVSMTTVGNQGHVNGVWALREKVPGTDLF